jgi:hypothetical protein
MVEQKKINLALDRNFSYYQLEKRGFANLYYKGFKIIFRTEILQLLALNIAQLTCEAQDRSVVWVLYVVTIPLSTTVNVFRTTYLCSYIKNRRLNKQVNKDKQYIRHKDINKDSFYLIFFDSTII